MMQQLRCGSKNVDKIVKQKYYYKNGKSAALFYKELKQCELTTTKRWVKSANTKKKLECSFIILIRTQVASDVKQTRRILTDHTQPHSETVGWSHHVEHCHAPE